MSKYIKINNLTMLYVDDDRKYNDNLFAVESYKLNICYSTTVFFNHYLNIKAVKFKKNGDVFVRFFNKKDKETYLKYLKDKKSDQTSTKEHNINTKAN